MIYYANLSSNIIWEVYKTEYLFDHIIKKKQKKVEIWWQNIDYKIVNYKWKKILFIEKLQEEIVEELKEYVFNNINKYWVDYYEEVKNFEFVCQFKDEIIRDKYWLDKGRKEIKKKLEKIKKQKKVEKVIDVEDINKISIEEVLDKLWIEYKRRWYVLVLYEDWKYTDRWRGNIEKNIITDFSWKWRAQGNPFSFVRQYYNLNNEETFEWFKQNFLFLN